MSLSLSLLSLLCSTAHAATPSATLSALTPAVFGSADEDADEDAHEDTPTRLLVRLAHPVDADFVSTKLGLQLTSAIPELDVYSVELSDLELSNNMQLDAILSELRLDASVVYAEPEAQMETFSRGPDPLRWKQWNIRQVGAPAAWSCGATGLGIVVAVVDTGLATYGRDAPRWLPGWDFVDDDNDPDDLNGHGTHVSGTIAQRTGNNYGVGGVSFNARILPVRVLDRNGMGSTTNVAAGIVWAVDHGADIINLSLGGSASSSVVEDAVNYARDADVVVVAAAGNNSAATVSYPAANSGAIAVAATIRGGDHAWYSNTGPEIAFAAPGGNTSGVDAGILQETTSGDDDGNTVFEEFVGTSMATPHVAAGYAMLLSVGATVTEATEAMATTAMDLGDEGVDETYGAGEIRLADAVRYFLTDIEGLSSEETDEICRVH